MIVACGTSYHAGLVGRYAIEQWARVPVEMDIASEYRYRNPVVGPDDLVIGITQSGETADTLAAMRLARERGATRAGDHQHPGQPGDPRRRRACSTRAPASRSASPRPRPSSRRWRRCTCSACGSPSCAARWPAERMAELIAELKAIPHRDRADAGSRARSRSARSRAATPSATSSSTSAATSACRSASRAR